MAEISAFLVATLVSWAGVAVLAPWAYYHSHHQNFGEAALFSLSILGCVGLTMLGFFLLVCTGMAIGEAIDRMAAAERAKKEEAEQAKKAEREALREAGKRT